jgi:hypothetical protein
MLQILEEKSEEKRPLGTPKSRQDDFTKVDLGEIGCEQDTAGPGEGRGGLM